MIISHLRMFKSRIQLKPRDLKLWFCMSKILTKRHKKKEFLQEIFTASNHHLTPKYPWPNIHSRISIAEYPWCLTLDPKKSYVKHDQPGESMRKPIRKIMSYIWWNKLEQEFHKLWADKISSDSCKELERNTVEVMIGRTKIDHLLQDQLKTRDSKLENGGWGVLPHRPYSLNLLLSDRQPFGSIGRLSVLSFDKRDWTIFIH